MTPEQQTTQEFTEALDQLLAAMNVPTRDQVHVTKAIADLLQRWDWDGEDSVRNALMLNLPIERRS
jgi:hypothetical protein